MAEADNELADYEEGEEENKETGEQKKGSYVAIHSSGPRGILLASSGFWIVTRCRSFA